MEADAEGTEKEETHVDEWMEQRKVFEGTVGYGSRGTRDTVAIIWDTRNHKGYVKRKRTENFVNSEAHLMRFRKHSYPLEEEGLMVRSTVISLRSRVTGCSYSADLKKPAGEPKPAKEGAEKGAEKGEKWKQENL